MYKIIDSKTNVMLLSSPDYKSILAFIIDHIDYKPKRHIIYDNNKVIPLSVLLRIQARISKYAIKQHREGDKVIDLSKSKLKDVYERIQKDYDIKETINERYKPVKQKNKPNGVQEKEALIEETLAGLETPIEPPDVPWDDELEGFDFDEIIGGEDDNE